MMLGTLLSFKFVWMKLNDDSFEWPMMKRTFVHLNIASVAVLTSNPFISPETSSNISVSFNPKNKTGEIGAVAAASLFDYDATSTTWAAEDV